MTGLDFAHSYNPNRLLDTLEQWLGIDSDETLSRMLRVSPQIIRGIRSGRRPVQASILLAMAEGAGTTIDELRRILGDRRRKARMACCIRTAQGRIRAT
jgi:hypothetical protein